MSEEWQRKSYPKNKESLTQKAEKALLEKQRKSYPKDIERLNRKAKKVKPERQRNAYPKGKESLTHKGNEQNDNSNTPLYSWCKSEIKINYTLTKTKSKNFCVKKNYTISS